MKKELYLVLLLFILIPSGSVNAQMAELADAVSLLERASSGQETQQIEEEEDEGVKVQRLVLLDEEDVVGKPVYVRLSPEKYVTRNTKHLPEAEQDWRTAWKVDRIDKWPDGQTLSADEVEGDIPF